MLVRAQAERVQVDAGGGLGLQVLQGLDLVEVGARASYHPIMPIKLQLKRGNRRQAVVSLRGAVLDRGELPVAGGVTHGDQQVLGGAA